MRCGVGLRVRIAVYPDFALGGDDAARQKTMYRQGFRVADMFDEPLHRVTSPALAPDNQAIDIEHLIRMTMGDGALQREVLALFDRQAEMLIARIRHGEPAVIAALAHILKGSARGIGAWQVATAAELVEAACAGRTDLAKALAVLDAAITSAHDAIAGGLAAAA